MYFRRAKFLPEWIRKGLLDLEDSSDPVQVVKLCQAGVYVSPRKESKLETVVTRAAPVSK